MFTIFGELDSDNLKINQNTYVYSFSQILKIWSKLITMNYFNSYAEEK